MMEELQEKFRRAVVLLQLLINANDFGQVEREARAQLREWGFKVPEELPAEAYEDLEAGDYDPD